MSDIFFGEIDSLTMIQTDTTQLYHLISEFR